MSSKQPTASTDTSRVEVAGGVTEQGVVVGNTYDKYGSNNPLVKWMMRGFGDALDDLLQRAAPTDIHEVGCGEGRWLLEWRARGLDVRGSELSPQVVELARANAREQGLSDDGIQQMNIYDADPARDRADLVVCCEVLEHLDEPERALEILRDLAGRHVILSVPREPLWRVLNMARFKYLGDLGNTPGHLQHWSSNGFVKAVSRHFEVLDVRKPLPWTMLLARPLPR